MRCLSASRVCLAFVLLGGAWARAAGPDVTVRTSLDRTAIWVADRVTYTIEITCTRGIEVLADDLSRDKLKTQGLEVIAADTSRRSASGDTTVHQFQYVLTTYRTDVATLTIAPMKVRYAMTRTGQRAEDAAPAGEAQVPGAIIAFRSVLPDDPDPAGIRSDKPAHARQMRFAALQPIGVGLIIVSIVPALFAIAAFARRTRRPRVRRSPRVVRHEERASLDALAQADVETVEGRREVFTALDSLVREHLRAVCGVSGAGLTPREVPFALTAAATKVPAELIASVLEACELGRYAPPHAMPSADACRETVKHVQHIVGT